MAVFDITNRCNLKCEYCCRGERLNSPLYKEPPLSDIKDTVKQLFEVNSNFIVLQGGEPLIRKDAGEIINYVAFLRESSGLHICNTKSLFNRLICERKTPDNFKNGYKRVLLKIGLPVLYISTNGMFYSDEILNGLVRASALMDISVDSFDPSVNMATRIGADIEVIKQNIIRFSEKLSVNISCTVTETNVNQLHLILEEAQQLGVVSVKFSPVIMIGKRDSADEFHDAYIEELFKVIETFGQKKTGMFLNIKVFHHQISTNQGQALLKLINNTPNIFLEIHECVACKCLKEIYIDPDLNVYGCASTKNIPEMALGNLHQNTLNEIWNSEKRLNALKKMESCYDIAQKYSGCTAAALQVKGVKH